VGAYSPDVRTNPSVAVQHADSLRELYNAGVAFDAFLGAAVARKELWHENWGLADVPADLLARARAIRGRFHLLVVAIDACSDSVNSIPVIAKLIEQIGAIDMRIVDSTRGRAIMESHRTPDDRAATPTIVLLDADYREAGCWIERPAKLIEWYEAKRGTVPQTQLTEQKMAWYRRDGGREILQEIIGMVEAASAGGRVCAQR
jgi:hypothetical protein